MQSNPIQQRVELICEKWEETKKNKQARIVHIRCQPDEADMVDTFYTYMIAADTPIFDIAFHFDSDCTDITQFSSLLLDELEETMDIWNNSQKDERIAFVPVAWQADRKLNDVKNPAALFVHNFNRLAKAMSLPDGLFAVVIIKNTGNKKVFIPWLKAAIDAGIDPAVRFLLCDIIDAPFFDEIIRSPQALAITTIPLNLDMPKAMEQIAAMGDPNDPATAYRHSFMKMMNEMNAGNETKAEKNAQECIRIANANLAKDPFWIMQVVVIYTALANDKMRYKKNEEVLAYANKGFETAKASEAFFENAISSGLVAQAAMFRGTVQFVQGKKLEAYHDFILAYGIYIEHGNLTLAVEAARMAGESAMKFSVKTDAIKILSTGARIGEKLDPQTVKATTYAGILDLLLQTDHSQFISMNELDKIGNWLYGNDWVKVVKNWKSIPDVAAVKKKEMEAA